MIDQYPIAAVLFSGHNERAVFSLCRFLADAGHPFYIISSDAEDVVYRTSWGSRVILQRTSSSLNLPLMASILEAVRLEGHVPVLCPTSEYLNRYALEQQDSMRKQGWHWMLPTPEVYVALSDKSSSPSVMHTLVGIDPPPLQPVGSWQAPCVLKPVRNILHGRVRYPLLCRSASELQIAMAETNEDDWFAQEWIEGQSHYLCAYLDSRGGWDAFWQKNLVQQPNGKSIVLAITGANPGLDVERLMRKLHLMGYRGPFMMEIIEDSRGLLHFIEVNPRFWGPLELCRRAHPALLQRFLNDMTDAPCSASSDSEARPAVYAWAFGSQQQPWLIYPAAASFSTADLHRQLQTYDVYASPDTLDLSNLH